MSAVPPATARPSLDQILQDSLHSLYVDDAYYARLRTDLAEWRGMGSPLAPAERATYEALVLHENWLLDQRDLEAWFGLYARECVYWIPANADMPDPVRGDPQRQVTIAFDDRRRLADRIVWLRTGMAYSQLPVSRTAHMSSGFVRLPCSDPDEVKIRSQFIVHETRGGHPVQVLAGWMGHVLRVEDGVLRIARKLVGLLDADRSHHNLTFIL